MADTETAAPVAPAISMFQDGPIQVDGPVALVRQRPVSSETGEPLTYETTASLQDAGRYFLCRCGGSGNKPFCDGTHNKIGFESDERAAGTYGERSSPLGGTRITVHDDRSICTHAGFCGNAVTNVWKLVADVDDDSRARAQAIAMIERCPSGALTYQLEGAAEANEAFLATAIRVLDDGPLVVTGGVPIANSAGESIETRNRVTLCRCGASANKPLCDGAHQDAGFEDPA
jgi:CDGSH-type Zn-finger protein/uncharacterized Fe-S cluster protein YjdI